MTYRSPRRWLAPLALIGAAAAIFAVVQHSNAGVGGGGPTSSTPASTATTRSTSTTGSSTTATTTTGAKGAKTYTVAAGDVLSSIAEKTHVSLARLEELNPSAKASSLHVGQKLKLAP